MLLLVNKHKITTEGIYLLGVDILNCFVLADLPKFALPRNSAGTPSSYVVNERLREPSSKSRQSGPFPPPPATACPPPWLRRHPKPSLATTAGLSWPLPWAQRAACNNAQENSARTLTKTRKLLTTRAHDAVLQGAFWGPPRSPRTHLAGAAGSRAAPGRTAAPGAAWPRLPSRARPLRPSVRPSVCPSARAGGAGLANAAQKAGAGEGPHRDFLLRQGRGWAPGFGQGRGGEGKEEGRRRGDSATARTGLTAQPAAGWGTGSGGGLGGSEGSGAAEQKVMLKELC